MANQNFRVKTGLEVGTGVTISAGIVTAVNLSSQQINISGVSTFAGITTVTGVTLFTKQLSVSGVSTFESDVKLGDSDSVYFGDNNNLRIFNDGSNSYILEQGIGNLAILGDSEVWIGNTAASEYKARFITDGAVELYYENVKKFETTGYGATVFGTLQSQGLQVSGISTLGNTIVGGGTTQLIVIGDARITGILTIGTSSITLDGSNNRIVLGTGTTISSTGAATFNNGLVVTGVVTATTFNGSGSLLTSIPNSALSNSTISGVSLGSNLNTLTLNTSGTGLSGSTTYNGSGASTFTVTSNATSSNTASAIVARDASGNFSAGAITGTSVSDSSGNVRAIPQNSQTSAYILAIGDVGKHISITTGGVTVNASIFSAGDAVTIYNNSGSNQTITQGTSVTLRSAGTANTGNRTLAQYGVCTVLCVASNTFVISGAGLS